MEKATAVAAAGTGRARKPGALTALDEAEKKEAPRGAFFVCCAGYFGKKDRPLIPKPHIKKLTASGAVRPCGWQLRANGEHPGLFFPVAGQPARSQ